MIIQTDFPDYSKYQMPEKLFRILSLSLIRKMILIFKLWFNPGLNNFFEERIKFQRTPKCCQSSILAIIMKILKMANIVYKEKCPPLGSSPINLHPQAKAWMQKPQGGGKFLVQIFGCAWGGKGYG